MLNELITLVAGIDADSLNFHAARYGSADLYRTLIMEVQEGTVTDADMLAARVLEIADATPYDGGDYLTIPCLGGVPQEVWMTLCYAHKESLSL